MLMSLPTSLPLTEEDFNKTPPAVQALVLAQWEEILVLREQISALREQIAVLTEQVSKNSKNSSRPLSSDPPSVEKPKRPRSGRNRGGQPPLKCQQNLVKTKIINSRCSALHYALESIRRSPVQGRRRVGLICESRLRGQ